MVYLAQVPASWATDWGRIDDYTGSIAQQRGIAYCIGQAYNMA